MEGLRTDDASVSPSNAKAMASSNSRQLPIVPLTEMRETDHPSQAPTQLARITSSGTWGEPERGEHVNVNQAKHDFQLARESSRTSAHAISRLRGGSIIGRALSGDDHSKRQSKINENHPDLEPALSDNNDDFDLGKWMLTRSAQAKEQGIDDGKPVGMLWRDISITSPGSSGGGIFVKTLPIAITNTAWRDPIGVLTTLIPPLSNLFAPRNMPTTNLLHSFSGILKPAEMLLVLGRPGSGCSTVLRAITSKNHSNVSAQGKLLYGGFTPDEINRKYRGEVVFVDEEDTHFPTLTVGQTLEFALKNKVPHRSRRLQGESRNEFIETCIDVMLKMFGMTHVRDTIVGDQAVRGVSGGERKRTTISEALATRASVIAWDNSTRGLDASTALDYARSLRIMTDLAQRSTIATLYQVSESIFDLFDRVAVIDDGRCIYYGPRKLARSYFYELGYDTPDRQTTADFVTALTDINQVVFRPGMKAQAPKTAEDRERVWRQSELYHQLESEMDSYEQHLAQAEQADQLKQTVRSEKRKGVRKASSYTVSYWDQIVSCMWRQLLIKWGARRDLYVKLFTIISVSFMISSLFYNQPFDSQGVFTCGGILLFACLFNGWLQLSESFEAVAGRPMLARHRQFAFYRPSAVVLARAITDIPFLAIQCFLSSIIIYFLSNLRRDAGAFWIFYVYCFLSSYSLTALYRMCAAFSPGFNEAIRFSVLSLNVLIIWVGYVLRRPQMNWMIWLSYAQPISYAFEGFLANEINYPINCAPSQIVPFGQVRDPAYQTCSLTGSVTGSIVVSSADYLGTTFGYSRSHIGRNVGVMIAFSVLYLIPTVIGAEIMNFGGVGGGVTVFARTKAAEAKLAASLPAKYDDLEEKAAVVASRPESGSDTNGNITRANSPAASAGKKSNGSSNKLATKSAEELDKKAIFTWKDLSLTLPTGRKLLDDITGYVKPGTITALMGASGAGKTTLLTALSQRGVAGALSGDVLVDGKPLGPGFQRGTGFVLQGDIHLASQTVREAIEFSALLRQPAEVPREEKLADAQRSIELLELEDLQDALIGVPGFGLGVERRKRVTIAIELAAKPDLLLFLDEPTSGLDSAGAASIIRLLRRLAEEGQAILCTIHQPSALLFESFDNLLLLQPGGRTAYFGQIGYERATGSDKVREYFERNGAPACPSTTNVAEYTLEVVAQRSEKAWSERWKVSAEARALRQQVEAMNAERAGRPVIEDSRSKREFSATLKTQIVECTKRQFRDLWRDAPFAYGILFSNIVTGFAAGGGFAHLGNSVTDLQYRVFVVFLVVLNFPATVNSIISKFWEMRITFTVREGPSKTYSWIAFMTAFVAVSIPIAVVASVLFFLPSFFLPFYSQPSTVTGMWFFMIFLVTCYEMFFSLALAAACPTPVTAANLLPFLLPFVAIVNGVIKPKATLPAPWSGLIYSNPLYWYVRSMVGDILHDLPVKCNQQDLAVFNPPPGETCGSYALQWVESVGAQLLNPSDNTNCEFCQFQIGDQFAATLGATWDFRWKGVGIVVGYTFGQLFLAYLAYWYFTEKRFGFGGSLISRLKRFGKRRE
ncbi:related to ATP-binding multidrug cassette transport protein [Melanopsichium pennsylvanicum]|uniref:Related to ATP-binding multidrug cassette transport protein n=1 Tax=Melanopsichium pennsylvanicum TaxID=63383 RepID=A0AAJ4XS73_9BASI|nr:related to ATP-binding multidrug cassette transport protein [Melanopsichium pennsylvanicum]